MSQPQSATQTTGTGPASGAAAIRPAAWFWVAAISLLLTGAVEAVCTVVHIQVDTIGRFFGSADGGLYFAVAAGLIELQAVLAAAAPALLAASRPVLRWMLIALHMLLAWFIQGVRNYSEGYGPEYVAELASNDLLAALWATAGFACGLLLLSLLFGWALTRNPLNSQRRRFSVRGMLVFTAAAALLFISPQIAPVAVNAAFRWVYTRTTLGRLWLDGRHRFDASADEMAWLIAPAVCGFLLTLTLVAGMWCRHSRVGAVGVVLGPLLTASLLAAVATAFQGGSRGLGIAVACGVAVMAGSLLAALQIDIWRRFGWHLVRTGRERPRCVESSAGPVSGDAE